MSKRQHTQRSVIRRLRSALRHLLECDKHLLGVHRKMLGDLLEDTRPSRIQKNAPVTTAHFVNGGVPFVRTGGSSQRKKGKQ